MSREDQFRQWAKTVLDHMLSKRDGMIQTSDWWQEQAQSILARAAYDLAQHAIGYSLEYLHECGLSTSGSMNSRIQRVIPDLPALPEEKAE